MKNTVSNNSVTRIVSGKDVSFDTMKSRAIKSIISGTISVHQLLLENPHGSSLRLQQSGNITLK